MDAFYIEQERGKHPQWQRCQVLMSTGGMDRGMRSLGTRLAGWLIIVSVLQICMYKQTHFKCIKSQRCSSLVWCLPSRCEALGWTPHD